MSTKHLETGELLWFVGQDIPEFEPLQKSIQADVCIVGAGIAGLTTAYHLAKQGQQVVVLEAKTLGNSETGRTSAHLSNALDDRYTHLENIFGEQGSRLAAESHTAAIDRIEQIARDENIDCELQRLDGYLVLAPEDSEDILDEELAAAHRAGLTQVEKLAAGPRPFETVPCLRFPDQAEFHPLKYLSGLALAVQRAGGKIYTESPVQTVEDGSKPKIVTTSGHTVQARAVVVATNSPVNNVVTLHTKLYAYRSYVLALGIPRDSIARAIWDTTEPYHYIRLESWNDEEDHLIVGGADHKTGQGHPEEAFGHLQEWAMRHFPHARETGDRWSGQIIEPVDSLAFIGRNPGDEHIYVVTGDSGHGLTHGTIAGMLLSDLILGKDNPWAELYDPARKTMKTAMTYLKENLNVAVQYIDHVIPGVLRSPEDLKPGEGIVVQQGLKKRAVCRDEDGNVTELSAVCPHLGCVVAWNPAEKSWDCPCHGSRFSPDGSVLNGPALQDLSPAD